MRQNSSAEPTNAVKVDQVGYLLEQTKIAFVSGSVKAGDFEVRRTTDHFVVFKSALSEAVHDNDTGDNVRTADFSNLRIPGRYYLSVPRLGQSWPFSVGSDVYRRAFYLVARSFYGQRCGIAVDLGPEFPGYKHGVCHTVGAYHNSSGKQGPVRSSGGWHDAGDYGRYVVNSGISTGTLLWAWELFQSRIGKASLQIPESGNGIPDLLNEARWNIHWMLAMQDEDGGVWHKQTSARSCGFVLPENDLLPSLVIGTGAAPFKSSCATGDLAAVAAIAARVFRPYDQAFAEQCSAAAKRAWAWLEKNPDVAFRNPPGISTGEYGDRNCHDERLWAAAELARTTHEERFTSYFLAHYADFLRAPLKPSWANVQSLALWTYSLSHGSNSAAIAQIVSRTTSEADHLVQAAHQNPYRTTMSATDYGWGSNGTAANYGLLLLIADALTPNPQYRQTALENLHYLLGRNTFSLSFVTRVGAHPFRHPHHRPSAARNDDEPWPGLLSGGPNRFKQDPAMQSLPDLPPARMYLDDQRSFATNEVAINWNAALVFLLAGNLVAP